MVSVHVAFRYQGMDWTRDFHVEQGATIRRLKEVMVEPEGGTTTDVDAIELRKRGHRVNEYDPIWEESYFDFMYLGPEDPVARSRLQLEGSTSSQASSINGPGECSRGDRGARRSAWDRATKESYERAARAEEEKRAREVEARRQREEEARRAAERESERSERKPKDGQRQAGSAAENKSNKQVEVTVKHAMEEMASQITVSVWSNSTVLDVRLAVMAALGESKLSEIKLVRKQNNTYSPFSNEMHIGDRREFLALGRILSQNRALDVPPVEEETVKITGIHDYVEQYVTLAVTKSVKELKSKLCEQVLRGPPSEVQLWLGEREIADSERVGAVAKEAFGGSLLLCGILLGPPQTVHVQVTHATSGEQVNVPLQDTATIRELREAVAAALGGTIASVRIVKKLAGDSWQSLPDSERLNGRSEFQCMGKSFAKAQAQAPPAVQEDVDLTLSICLDSSLGISQDIQVKKWSSVYSVKELLAAGDPTHRTKPEDFGLSLTSAPDVPLPDSTLITEEHLQLNLLTGASGDEEAVTEEGPAESGLAGVCITGKWKLTCQVTGGSTSFDLLHEPGAQEFAGWQEDGSGEIYDCRLSPDGKIHWKLSGGWYSLDGQLDFNTKVMRDVFVTSPGDNGHFGPYIGILSDNL